MIRRESVEELVGAALAAGTALGLACGKLLEALLALRQDWKAWRKSRR